MTVRDGGRNDFRNKPDLRVQPLSFSWDSRQSITSAMTEQPGPASNRASTLRRPQGRHPSRFQPAIDLSMAKLTPKQVRQWERNNEGRLHSGRCWYMTIVTLRIISLVFTISLAVIGISLVNLYFYDRQNYTMVPSIISVGQDFSRSLVA